jgi:hypothetical protein
MKKDKAYVDVTDNLTFLNDNSFIWTSEKDGFNHIYLYDKNGKLRNQVTKGSGSNFIMVLTKNKYCFLSVYGERINQPSHL